MPRLFPPSRQIEISCSTTGLWAGSALTHRKLKALARGLAWDDSAKTNLRGPRRARSSSTSDGRSGDEACAAVAQHRPFRSQAARRLARSA
eukprot:1881886-Pyramimonas_sp.AAC.1